MLLDLARAATRPVTILPPRRSGRGTLVQVAVLTAACLFVLAPTASAQSGIVGVVKDASGAVLPGVTVEARAPR